jgi:hypothetical protein
MAQPPPKNDARPAPGSVSHYRREGELRIIDVRAAAVAQLFNSLDPAPFQRKDLDPEVEGYILAALREVGGPRRAKLVFHLPAEEMSDPTGKALVEALHTYFAYSEWAVRQELRTLARRGAASLAIGLAFLFLCLAARNLAAQLEGQLGVILSEGLLIMGWVAMWRPLELLLYDWWPLWRRRRMYHGLLGVPVACVESPPAA